MINHNGHNAHYENQKKNTRNTRNRMPQEGMEKNNTKQMVIVVPVVVRNVFID